MEFQEILEKIQNALSMGAEAIAILQSIVIAVLAGKVSRNTKTVQKSVAPLSKESELVATVSSSNPTSVRKQLVREFNDAMLLYFSGKEESEMTDDEKALFKLANTYLTEVKNG